MYQYGSVEVGNGRCLAVTTLFLAVVELEIVLRLGGQATNSGFACSNFVSSQLAYNSFTFLVCSHNLSCRFACRPCQCDATVGNLFFLNGSEYLLSTRSEEYAVPF